MPEEDNAALVAQFLDELWNQRNLDIIDRLTTEDYVVHVPQGDLLGREALKIVATQYFESFSRIRLSVGDQTCLDSQVVTPIEWDTALMLGMQPLDQGTGREISREIPARGVSRDRIDDGQIAESWNMLDTLYWLFNIQEVSRHREFVVDVPALKLCDRRHPCGSKDWCCVNGHCLPPFRCPH